MGLNYGVDFRGGTVIEAEANSGAADIANVRTVLEALELGDVQIQRFGDESTLLIRLGTLGSDESAAASVQMVRDTLGSAYTFRRVESVGPSVSSELVRQSIIAVLLGTVAIFGYLWIRFEWQFALGATLTTLHDIILMVGLYSLLQIDFDLTSIAAILTIMGYSLNDTVVVYDRIRDMLRRYKNMPLSELLDLSINATFSRTVIVAATTFFAVLALFLFGGDVLRGFSLAMLFGVVVGTYSTIFIAAPILIYLKLRPSPRPVAAVSVERAKVT
jgi:preprotein translocase subunit SecF/SecD/SecF fusion protein